MKFSDSCETSIHCYYQIDCDFQCDYQIDCLQCDFRCDFDYYCDFQIDYYYSDHLVCERGDCELDHF